MAAGIGAAAVFGALIGSFLSVVASRVPAHESIVYPGSACPSCGRELRWRENVPIVSWLLLTGRCAGCGESVSLRYPALEVGTALAFGAVVAIRGFDTDLVLELPFAALLIVIAVIDAEHRIVPNPIVLAGAAFAVAAGLALDVGGLPEQLIAGAASFAAFLLIALAYPAGMGMGDVKLAGMMGLFLGLDVVPALLVAFLAGSVVGLAVVAKGGMDKRKTGLPFAPFLACGGLVALLAGPELIDLYVDRFL